jgi:hypothetical protein
LVWLESEQGPLRMLIAAEAALDDSLRVGWERRHELWFDAAAGARLDPPG